MSAGLGRKSDTFVPTDSWFGRAEVTDEGLSVRRTSQATAGSARTRQGTSGSLEPPFAAAPSDVGHFLAQGRRKPLPQWRSAVASNNLASETYRSGQAPTTGAQPASATARQRLAAGTARPRRLLRVSGWLRALPARVGYCASAVGCGHCPPASAIARGLRPPFRLFELHSAIQIRSEVSAPARLWPREADAIGGAFVPADFWFGRARDTDGGYFLRRTG